MSDFFRRLKMAWVVLTERIYVPTKVETRYVLDQPEHLVSLTYFHDFLVGLDGQGRLWKIDVPYDCSFPTFTLWAESPRLR